MDPLGLGPTEGPDPAHPGAWFESGDHWYLIGVFPLRLSHGFAISLGVSNRPIWSTLYEEGVGALAARVDPRHKLVVWRKKPPLFGGSGWAVVHLEVHPDRDSAGNRRTEMVVGWDPRLFSDAPALSARQVRRTLSDARAGRAPVR